MLIKIVEGVPTYYSTWELKKDNPSISFPEQISDDILASFGVFPCVEEVAPKLTEYEQLVRTNISLVDGVWTQHFSKEYWPRNQAEDSVREKRNNLLAETDWTALVDSTLSSDMATYRQSLRDITSQVGFPYAVTWPTKPE